MSIRTNQHVAHMVDYYYVQIARENERNGHSDYVEDLIKRHSHYAHACLDMVVSCTMVDDEYLWACISVVDYYGMVWQERELCRKDYKSDLEFYTAIADKMRGYHECWIEGKE